MSRHIEIKTKGMHEMEDQFEKASIPNLRTKSFNKLENLFHAANAATRSKVHVDTGYLKGSGRSESHFVGDVWLGEISYARHPGIFELALGDTPSKMHPAGGHHFFNAIEPFIPYMEAAINDVFNDYFGKTEV